MAATDPELHISVVAFGSGPGYDLAEEIALVKAALLYADHVTLASPRVAMVSDVAGYLTATPAEREDILLRGAGVLPDGVATVPVARQLLEAVRKKKYRTRDEIITLRRTEAQLAKSAREMEEKVREIVETAAPELEVALRAKVLTLDPLGIDNTAITASVEAAATGANQWATTVTRNLADLIADVLSPESTTYPMFSEVTRGLARAMIRERKIEGAELAPATQAGIAGRFIGAIDAFPDAPMDVVLDARGELRGVLRRFRAGVSRVSRELDAQGIHALDPRFEHASADLYRQHVAPALQEIEELSRELGLRNALLRTSPTVAHDVALASLALAMTSGGGIETLATIAAGATGDLLGRAGLRQREIREKRDKNEWVFLYEADRHLQR